MTPVLKILTGYHPPYRYTLYAIALPCKVGYRLHPYSEVSLLHFQKLGSQGSQGSPLGVVSKNIKGLSGDPYIEKGDPYFDLSDYVHLASDQAVIELCGWRSL